MTQTNVTVIGGAITGPAAALNLARRDYNVTVYEARPADDLVSAGILGLTHDNWEMLESESVNIGQYELANGFYDYQTMTGSVSPFRYITWTGLHNALTAAGQSAGVRYEYRRHIAPGTLTGSDITVEATGVAGAAQRMLPHRYSGTTIYRGLSNAYVFKAFIVWRDESRRGEYFTVGDTPQGAFWAYFVKRPEPSRLTTRQETRPPTEANSLPDEFQGIVYRTSEIFATPLSDWKVPASMRNAAGDYITIGDVNGPVRPVTTSGANLAVMEGFDIHRLLNHRTARHVERMMLGRRAYDLELGALLESSPEIGGAVEDTMFVTHHRALFGSDD